MWTVRKLCQCYQYHQKHEWRSFTCLDRVTVAQHNQSPPLSSKNWKIQRIFENLAWSLCKTDSPIVIKFFWSIHFINWIWFVCAKYSPRTSFFAKLTTWSRGSRTEILDADHYVHLVRPWIPDLEHSLWISHRSKGLPLLHIFYRQWWITFQGHKRSINSFSKLKYTIITYSIHSRRTWAICRSLNLTFSNFSKSESIKSDGPNTRATNLDSVTWLPYSKYDSGSSDSVASKRKRAILPSVKYKLHSVSVFFDNVIPRQRHHVVERNLSDTQTGLKNFWPSGEYWVALKNELRECHVILNQGHSHECVGNSRRSVTFPNRITGVHYYQAFF